MTAPLTPPDPYRIQPVRVRCVFCGAEVIVWVTPDSWVRYDQGRGPKAQIVFSYLSAAERELLITMQCTDCFNESTAPAYADLLQSAKWVSWNRLPTWVRRKAEAHPRRAEALKEAVWFRFPGEGTFYAYADGKWIGQYDLFDV